MASVAQLQIDPNSNVPAVRQIQDGLRVLLVEGSLTPGEELPSVRRVAMELGVHFNTVAEAYRQLAAEGWLDQRHGRGAVVIQRSAPDRVEGHGLEDFRQRLRALVAQMRSDGVQEKYIAHELRAVLGGLEK
jgi:DNA-binding transcriptional regulator YhcF (GntR family)